MNSFHLIDVPMESRACFDAYLKRWSQNDEYLDSMIPCYRQGAIAFSLPPQFNVSELLAALEKTSNKECALDSSLWCYFDRPPETILEDLPLIGIPEYKQFQTIIDLLADGGSLVLKLPASHHGLIAHEILESTSPESQTLVQLSRSINTYQQLMEYLNKVIPFGFMALLYLDEKRHLPLNQMLKCCPNVIATTCFDFEQMLLWYNGVDRSRILSAFERALENSGDEGKGTGPNTTKHQPGF